MEAWRGFERGKWCEEIDVRDFIQRNYVPYEGDGAFLAPATEATKKLWKIVCGLSEKEREKGGVYDADTKIVSMINSHKAGYFDRSLEKIVGIQTDEPFKRALQPFGGIRMAEEALAMYGYRIDGEVKDVFTRYRKTHNAGVFDAYTPEMRRARHAHILTGLPDTYGRGRIVGDYRRVALYGVDYLIAKKQEDKLLMDGEMLPEKIRDREELSEQIRALGALKEMAAEYGFDISRPRRKREGSHSVAVFRLSRRRQGSERRCDEYRQEFDVSRRLYPTRFGRGDDYRNAGAGIYRPLRHEAARRKIHAYQGI